MHKTCPKPKYKIPMELRITFFYGYCSTEIIAKILHNFILVILNSKKYSPRGNGYFSMRHFGWGKLLYFRIIFSLWWTVFVIMVCVPCPQSPCLWRRGFFLSKQNPSFEFFKCAWRHQEIRDTRHNVISVITSPPVF